MRVKLAVLTASIAALSVAVIAQEEQTEQPNAETPPTTVIDELSQAEIDAELERAEKVLDDPEEVEEYTDDTPLPADLPLALPSDF